MRFLLALLLTAAVAADVTHDHGNGNVHTHYAAECWNESNTPSTPDPCQCWWSANPDTAGVQHRHPSLMADEERRNCVACNRPTACPVEPPGGGGRPRDPVDPGGGGSWPDDDPVDDDAPDDADDDDDPECSPTWRSVDRECEPTWKS